jgi:hypothetical protein
MDKHKINELDKVITSLTNLRDSLVNTPPGDRKLPVNKLLQDQVSSKPQTWEDQTDRYWSADILHRENTDPSEMLAKTTLRADTCGELLTLVVGTTDELHEEDQEIYSINIKPHVHLKYK